MALVAVAVWVPGLGEEHGDFIVGVLGGGLGGTVLGGDVEDGFVGVTGVVD